MTTVLEKDGDMARIELPGWLPKPGEDGMWGLDEIAAAAGLSYAAAAKWRSNYGKDVAAGRPLGAGSLPKEDRMDHAYNRKGPGYPRWLPETIIRWLQQTGRMGTDMRPIKLSHRGGRPRGSASDQPRNARGRFLPARQDPQT